MTIQEENMRTGIKLTAFVLLILSQAFVIAAAPVKLVRGEDYIIVPATNEGLCFHNLFQSSMVIQRDKPIEIWGWATPGEEVKVKLGDAERSAVTGKDRSWKVVFPAMPASADPIEITVKGKSKRITLNNVLVGDVWVLGGQSNMEHPISRVEDGDLEIISANFDKIRILTVPAQNGPKVKKTFPRLYEWHSFFNTHYRKGDWDVCTPESVRELSGIGYVYARRIHMASQIPIGVIDISRGGTCIETWLPLDVLQTVDTPKVKAKISELDQKIAAFDGIHDVRSERLTS